LLGEHEFEMSIERLTWSETLLWSQFQALRMADPSALALVDCEEKRWTRDELHQTAKTISARLRASGIGPEDRVAMIAHKTAMLFAAALAVSEVEAIFCPLSVDLDPRSRSWVEERLGHAAMIVEAPAGKITIEVLDRASRSQDSRDSKAVLIAFTSGTTGFPKGVMHGSAALNYVTRACAANAGLVEGEPILGAIPLDSVAGFTFTAHFSLSLGHPLVLLLKWNAVRALDLLSRYRCAWTTMVPTQLFLMVEAARTDHWRGPLALRAISVGGSPMTPELICDAKAVLEVEALRMFGMSECLAHCSTRLDDSSDRRLLFDGKPFPATQMEAFDENSRVLPRLQRGEAGVRGPALFLGYCKGMGAGQERMTADGFYLTGDEMATCASSGESRIRLSGAATTSTRRKWRPRYCGTPP
jgi:acyl-CoA synthetase